MQKLLYTKRDAAAMLSISLRSLEYLIVRGDVKVRRIGGCVLVHHKELERVAAHDSPAFLAPKRK